MATVILPLNTAHILQISCLPWESEQLYESSEASFLIYHVISALYMSAASAPLFLVRKLLALFLFVVYLYQPSSIV